MVDTCTAVKSCLQGFIASMYFCRWWNNYIRKSALFREVNSLSAPMAGLPVNIKVPSHHQSTSTLQTVPVYLSYYFCSYVRAFISLGLEHPGVSVCRSYCFLSEFKFITLGVFIDPCFVRTSAVCLPAGLQFGPVKLLSNIINPAVCFSKYNLLFVQQ